MPKLDEQERREILRLKAEFRVKYPFDVAKRLSRLSSERNVWSMIGLKPDEFEQVMDFYLDKNLLQDEIAHIKGIARYRVEYVIPIARSTVTPLPKPRMIVSHHEAFQLDPLRVIPPVG